MLQSVESEDYVLKYCFYDTMKEYKLAIYCFDLTLPQSNSDVTWITLFETNENNNKNILLVIGKCI